MRELLIDLVPAGIDIIIALQAALGDRLDPLFRAITWLGDMHLYLALLPLALWQGDPSRGRRLALLLLYSVYLNLLLKGLFAIPRPYLVSSAVQAKDAVTGYAFPSGHAQGATVAWMGVALVCRRRWAAVIGAFVVPLVAFSRVYLGVHYPQDAVAGIAVGLAVVGAYALLTPPLIRGWRRLPFLVAVALCLLVPLALATLTRDGDAHAAAGAIFGLGLAFIVDPRGPGHERPVAGARAVTLRFIVGAAVTGLAYGLPSLAVRAWWPATPSPALVTAGRYALVALAASTGACRIFRRLALTVPPTEGHAERPPRAPWGPGSPGSPLG